MTTSTENLYFDDTQLEFGDRRTTVRVVSDGTSIVGVWLGPQLDTHAGPGSDMRRDGAPVAAAVAQLQAYAAGDLKEFDLPLRPGGTEFQRAVWDELRQIPFGTTTTYGRIAHDLGRPTGSRAVGSAVGSNPIGIVIPCHRVIGANGSLTGYAGGLDNKISLLRLEGVTAL